MCIIHEKPMRSCRRCVKIRLVEIFGGKCIMCGYNKSMESLHFHHRDPGTKSFGIGKGTIRKFERLLEEARKCDLVCANCHSEIHESEGRLK